MIANCKYMPGWAFIGLAAAVTPQLFKNEIAELLELRNGYLFGHPLTGDSFIAERALDEESNPLFNAIKYTGFGPEDKVLAPCQFIMSAEQHDPAFAIVVACREFGLSRTFTRITLEFQCSTEVQPGSCAPSMTPSDTSPDNFDQERILLDYTIAEFRPDNVPESMTMKIQFQDMYDIDAALLFFDQRPFADLRPLMRKGIKLAWMTSAQAQAAAKFQTLPVGQARFNKTSKHRCVSAQDLKNLNYYAKSTHDYHKAYAILVHYVQEDPVEAYELQSEWFRESFKSSFAAYGEVLCTKVKKAKVINEEIKVWNKKIDNWIAGFDKHVENMRVFTDKGFVQRLMRAWVSRGWVMNDEMGKMREQLEEERRGSNRN